MPRALVYLLYHHIVGSWRFRLKRLKQPKYLVGTLAVFGYFYLLFVGSFSKSIQPKAITQPELAGLMVSLFLTFQFGLIWLLAGRFTGLGFSEAETEILFAAPLTRKELIRYRLLKSQPGILFSSLFLVIIISLSWEFPSLLLSFLAAFVLLNIIQAFQVLTAVLHGLWQDRWWSGLIKLAGIAILIAPILLTKSPPESSKGAIGSILLWGSTVSLEGGWLAAHVWIGQFIVTSSFREWLPRLIVCLLWLTLLYQLIVWFNFGFEEKEMAQARKRASTLRSMREGRAIVVKDQPVKTSLFPLAWTGAPWRAIAWKNMTALSRHLPRGFLFAIFYILFLGILFALSETNIKSFLTGSGILAVIALFLTFMGSSVMKEDLRSDLGKIDILQALPISPLDIIRGEIFGAAFVIIAVTLTLLGGSAILLMIDGSFGLSVSSIFLGTSLVGCLSSGIILLSFSIENALALSFPAWVLPDRESTHQHTSIDQMGRSIVLVIARFFLLTLLIIPPSLWMLITLQSALVLKSTTIMVIGAAGFAVIAWGETEIIILWLARLFNKLDASQEGL